MRSVAVLISVTACLCLLAGSPSPAHARDPGPQVRRSLFALTGWQPPTPREAQSLGRRGLRSYRLALIWESVEPRRGRFNWASYDAFVERLASRRIGTFFMIYGCPAWACHGGKPTTGSARSAWSAFVRAAVRRYGNGGSFWRAHPGLPYLPVSHWQVWNEVNGAFPRAPVYASLLHSSAQAIRAADPTSRVVLGGLGEKMAVWLRDYLPRLYAVPGFAGDFDVMAPEGYAVKPKHLAGILRTTRRIMRRFGDRAKPLWITEMSWATGGPPFPFVTTRRGQARKLRVSYDLLMACRKRWNLQRVYWFGLRDKRAPGADYWGYHNGLLTVSGRWKPAMRRFVQYLRKRLPRGHRTTCRRAARAARARL